LRGNAFLQEAGSGWNFKRSGDDPGREDFDITTAKSKSFSGRPGSEAWRTGVRLASSMYSPVLQLATLPKLSSPRPLISNSKVELWSCGNDPLLLDSLHMWVPANAGRYPRFGNPRPLLLLLVPGSSLSIYSIILAVWLCDSWDSTIVDRPNFTAASPMIEGVRRDTTQCGLVPRCTLREELGPAEYDAYGNSIC
jgi:hypothetical protein